MMHVADQLELPGMPAPVAQEPDHSIRGHAHRSPSKANYLDPSVGGCPGFASSSGTSAAAEEGTAHHEMLDKLLGEWWALREKRGTFKGYLSGRRIALRWSDEAHFLYCYCADVIDKYAPKANDLHREIRVVILRRDGSELTFGHFDVLLILGDVGLLLDWKFGILPVHPAEENRQGFMYAIGVMQRWLHLSKVGVIFVQPRLQWVSKHMIARAEMPALLEMLEAIDAEAERVENQFAADPKSVDAASLNPGDACKYCSRGADCKGYLGKLQVAAPRYGALPAPADFRLEAIDTPEKAAVAHAWASFLEDRLPQVKQRCLQIAKEAGGELRCTGEDGQEFILKVRRRGFDRALGQAPLVADCLAELGVVPEQVLAAATLSVGALENVVVPVLQEQDETLSKKDAKERLTAHLEANGLISQPDGYIEYLQREKQQKEPKPKKKKKQITQ